MRHRIIDSPLGELIVVVDESGALIGLYNEGQRHLPPLARLGERDDTVAQNVVDQLDEYFAGERTSFDLPLAPKGTPFQRSVWDALTQIPLGQTMTYGGLATDLGRPQAARAVGAAVGRNPISIVVPCHRVVGGSGALTGYAGGLGRKRWLLAHEQSLDPEPLEQ